MIDYQFKYDKLYASFELTWALYVDTCEDLLDPLTLPTQEFEKLLHEPVSADWGDPLLRTRLKTRLGRSYDSYLHSTKQLEIKVIKLRDILKLKETFMVSSEALVLYFLNRAIVEMGDQSRRQSRS